MIQDDEFELMMVTDERVQTLGFRPQKEILTSHLLPYSDEFDEESNNFLEQVKTNLAKSVMLREMKPACGVWTSRLMKYIRIYGLKFSKEDHIAFVKLAYELVLIPDLEPCKLQKFATLFIMLTKKRHLISPEELTLPWRPLFNAGKQLFDKNSVNIGMFNYPTNKQSGNQEVSVLDMIRKLISGNGLDDAIQMFGLSSMSENNLPTSLEGSYLSMVKYARPYFAISATKEILEEFMPYILTWSGDSQLIAPFSFLPVGLHPKYASQGHELWFDELISLWDTCYNSQSGDPNLMVIFSNLAKRNPGAVDWTPHVPKMFMRFLHILNLPVSYKNMKHKKNQRCVDMKHVASWIVWTINPDGVVLKHLRSFLAGIESYLHTANVGLWSFKLRDLLKKLAKEFLNRVRREREKKFLDTWENNTPEAYKLREEDITEFVKIVMEPTMQAVYNRSGAFDYYVALQNLATLRPAIVVPPLLEKLRTSLTSLTEPHRVTAAMSAVAAIARPLLRGKDSGYPEGQTHVVSLLMAVLPGLDPNDIRKTMTTLQFIFMFSVMVPLIDCSSAHQYWPDLTEEELLTCESTAQFEDFVLLLLDKLFMFIDSNVQENVRLDTKDTEGLKSKMDAIAELSISTGILSVLMQCSPKIFKEALRKFKSFATETTYETNVSGSMIGTLLREFARVDPDATVAAFLPQLSEELQELLSVDEALHDENPPRSLLYRLVLLMHLVTCDGTVLLKYMDQILPILDRALKLHSKYALSIACDALANIFKSLSFITLKEWRSSTKDYGSAPEKWLPIREWGHGCPMKDANFKWHVPSAEEAACAQMLVDRYMKPEVNRLRQWLTGERTMCRERRLRSFHIIDSVFSSNKFLPPPNEETIPLLDSRVPATNIPFTNGVKHMVTLDGVNMRVAITKLLVEVQARMLADKTDDTRGLDMLVQVWEKVILMKNGSGLETRLRSFSALEQSLGGKGCIGKSDAAGARLRTMVAEAVRLQEDARRDLVCDAGITPTALEGLNALFDLSINTYSSIRITAQARLSWLLSYYPYSYRVLVPKLAEVLSSVTEDDEGHARHKGALCIMLGPKSAPLVSKQDWEVVRVMWPAIVKAPLSEKPSLHRLEQAFHDVLHRHFPATNTKLKITEESVETAKLLLTQKQLEDPEFVKQLNSAEEYEKSLSDKNEKLYLELVNELVDIAESSNVQWRRLDLVMHMLMFCASLQTPYPARAVQLFTKSLIHENIVVRKVAQKLTLYALKQRKRTLKKIKVDPYEIAGVAKPEKRVPGYRKDLEWAVWSKDRVLKTDEEWDKPWLRTHTYGFYAWPPKIEVAAPLKEQNFAWDTAPEDMEEGERYIFEFFNDEENVNKLINFLTVEEKKGKDKFNGTRSALFRMLFAHYGLRITGRVMQQAAQCAGHPEEAKQRFAAEVASAALRAPRYWRRADALQLQKTAMDIVTTGLTSVTAETLEDWGTAMSTAADKMDPVRNSEVLRAVLELCAPPPSNGDAPPDQKSSFVASARLYALQGMINAMVWRAAPLASELLARLESANFIQHPYENVRATVGGIIMTIFNLEIVFPSGEPSSLAPCLKTFLDTVKPRLAALYDENGDIVIKSAASMSVASCGSTSSAPHPALPRATRSLAHAHADRLERAHDQVAALDGTEEHQLQDIEMEAPVEKLSEQLEGAMQLAGDSAPAAHAHHERAVNLLTTVLSGCMGVVLRGTNGQMETLIELVPIACALASRGASLPHEELPRAATGFLAAFAQTHFSDHSFDCALKVLEDMASSRSWWARLACLDLALPLLFYGLPMLCEQPERAVRAESFAIKLMRDSRLEVRKSGAKLLTGLMHCRALPNEDDTLRSLVRSCRSKVLDERHCGVLGLCAYLSSRPYSLGPKLGEVLAELARYTNAPDPIPATIRTALADFRRTHQDDWPKHREQLTEEELDLLADLTSPPSYCA